MFVKNAQALAVVLPLVFAFSACGDSIRGQLMYSWTMTSMKCNTVTDATYAAALSSGASVILLVEDGTFRKTLRNSAGTCSHVRQGTYSNAGDLVSFVNSGSVSCTPSDCSLQAEFNEGNDVCGSANTATVAPTVTFRAEGNVQYMELTYSSSSCGGATNDVKVETYRR